MPHEAKLGRAPGAVFRKLNSGKAAQSPEWLSGQVAASGILWKDDEAVGQAVAGRWESGRAHAGKMIEGKGPGKHGQPGSQATGARHLSHSWVGPRHPRVGSPPLVFSSRWVHT